MQALRKQMKQNPIVVWLAGAGILAIIAVVFVVISSQGGPPAIVGDYTIRALSELSDSELVNAMSEGVIPHQRLADGGFVLGFPSAPVTVVAFEDFACSHCQAYESTIAQLIETYVATGRARFEYRFFPTTDQRTGGYHSKLAACVGELAEERFWLAHEFLYARGSSGRLYSEDTGRLLAEETGVDYAELLECTQTVRQVGIDVQLGTNIGVRGTPAVALRYPDGQLTQAQGAPSFPQLSAIIEAAALQ